ncbi:hypothetical protein ES319_D09G092800v1 [Gossypium barbadense]|uniref:Uncharacterized protein n=1 Tax=Gossypium barbadense TaxID=3634 RepID=A0A5J5Q192_GOSBA|nr:hypothetical protein ES319_D09G092800v1 [Gossypium barbadense]
MDLKVGVEKDGAAVGAKLFQKRSWKERALAFANNGNQGAQAGLYLKCCLTRGGLRRRGRCSDEDC